MKMSDCKLIVGNNTYHKQDSLLHDKIHCPCYKEKGNKSDQSMNQNGNVFPQRDGVDKKEEEECNEQREEKIIKIIPRIEVSQPSIDILVNSGDRCKVCFKRWLIFCFGYIYVLKVLDAFSNVDKNKKTISK